MSFPKKQPIVWASNLRMKRLAKCQVSRALTFSIWNRLVNCPMTVSTKRPLDSSWLTNAFGLKSCIFFVKVFANQYLAVQALTLGWDEYSLCRRLASRADRHRKAVNQVDRVLLCPHLPRNVSLYASFQIPFVAVGWWLSGIFYIVININDKIFYWHGLSPSSLLFGRTTLQERRPCLQFI